MQNYKESLFEEVDILRRYRDIFSTDAFAEEFAVGQASGLQNHYEKPHRILNFCIFLILNGKLRVGIDHNVYDVGVGGLLAVVPMHVIEVHSCSDDFRVMVCVVSMKLLGGIIREFSPLQYIQVKENPLVTIDQAEIDRLMVVFRQLEEKAAEKDNIFRREIVSSLLSVLLCEIGNITHKHVDEHENRDISRKEEIFRQFVVLLSTHFKEQHSVGFYARQICITAQHLSSVLKQISGKTTTQFIADALISEAKVMLRTPRTSVQQVASILNFPDQSTFGKFFKKHVGVSPLEYRKDVAGVERGGF